MAHVNICRSQSLHTATSARKEARQTAGKQESVMSPDDSHAALELAGQGGQHGQQSHRRHKQPWHLWCPPHSSHQMGFPPSVSGREGGQWQHTAPGTCKLTVTQPPPPPPHTSSYLKQCLSSVSFASHFPYDS